MVDFFSAFVEFITNIFAALATFLGGKRGSKKLVEIAEGASNFGSSILNAADAAADDASEAAE